MIQALKKTLAAFCALTFLSMQCQAQYIVDTNAGGSGTPGTLDYAITNASNLSGAVITFTQSAANGASSSINDTDKVSLTINMGGQNGTLSGVISDGSSAGALIVPDTGKLTLSGYNSYTGGTTISNNAVLSVAIDLNLGGTSGGLTFDGGTLQTTGALSSGRGVTLNAGGGTIDTDGKADMLYGAIGGAGILTVMSSAVDSGKLTLSGANNYNGGTSINWASVQANAAGALGTGAVTMSNASLILGSDQAIGSLTGDSSSKAELDAQLTTGGDNTDTAFAGTISGSGALVKSGSGVFTIASSNNGKTNTYTGGTTVSAGTLGIYADSDLGATAGALTLNGATLRTVGGLTLNSSRVVNLSGGGTIDTYGQSDTIAGGVSGSGGLNVASSAGSGTLTLSGGNSYTGGTTVANTATLAVYSDANLGAASGGLALSGSGATLRTLGNVTLASPRAVTLGSGGGALSGGTIDTYGNADSIAGAISGGGTAGLNVTSTSGSGTLALSGANTYTGGTTVNTGATLAINSDGNLGAASGGLTLSGGTLQTLGSLTLNSSRAVTLSGASKIDTDGNNATVSGVVSGAGLTKIGAGTLTLSGANAYTGATTINAGTLSVANVGNLGSTSGIAFGGGTLQTTAGISSGLAVTLNSGGGTIDTHGQTDTLSGAIGGTGGLTKTGAGTLTLSDASNSYSGGTTINAGTLRIADVHDLGSPTVLSIITFNGGTLETTSGVTISALDTVTIGGGGGTIQTDNQTDTISGLITGTGRLTIVGTGLTLTNAGNNYSGGTVFNGAALTASALGNFGTGGVTLDNSSSLTLTADQALASLGGDSSSTVALNNHALTTGSDGTSTTFAGVISGSGGSLVMNGAGTFTLSGVNTYTGGTTISAGTLAINTDSSLGDASGGLTFNGGTLQTTSALASGRAVTLTGAGTIDTDGNNATLSGLVIGSGRLTKTGAGTLTLTDAGNSYSGGTTINAGILSIASVGALGSPLPGNSLTFNGGTLQTTSGLTYAGAVALNGGGGTIDADGQTDTISGAIGGAGTLTLTDSSGGGTLTLTGANTYGGGTAIIGSGGVHLLAGAQNVLGAGAVSMSGGDLDLNGFNQTIGSLSGDVNSTVELDGKTLTTGADNTSTAFAGVISDGGASGSLVKNGNGTFILSGANAYTGGTTINAGTLAINSDSSLGAASGGLAFNGGTLKTTSGVTSARGVTLTGAGTIDADGNNSTFSGVLAGNGGLTVADSAGGGVLTLSGVNIYRGGTTVASASTLVINLDSGLGDTSGGLVLSGGTLRTLGGVTLDPLRTVTLSGGGTIDTFGQSDACSAAIGGTGGLTVASSVGGGVLALSGANTYTGGTTISNAATLAIDNDGNLGPTSGGLVFKGGTLRTLSALTLDSSRAVTLNSGGGTIDTYGQSDAYSGVIGGAGGLSVASSVGGGVLTLSGVNTYGGGTTLNSGTLAVSGNQNLGASSGGLAFNGGTLRTTSSGFTSSRAVTLNNGGGTLDTDGQTDTLSGVIGGAGRLTVMDSSVLGGGTLLLSAANTYSGGTAINGAGLQSSAAGALGAGAVTMNSAAGRAADLNLNGYNQAIGSLAGDANSTVELSGAQLTAGADNTNTTFAGVISDGSFAGSLVKNGGGIFTLSGANTYTGPTTINAGALQLGADNALWSGGSLFVSNGGTFDLNGFNQTMAAATNNGTIKTGTGALKVTGSYGGGGNLSVALAPSVINLQVTGTANLTGQNLTVTGRPASGQYTVVQAGTLVGRFSSIGMPAGYLETATYGNTSLQLQVALGVAPLSGASPNQSSVINAMNSAAASNTSADFNQVLTALSNLAPAQAGSALNQISPVSLAAMSGVSSAGSSVHTAAVGQRMGGLQANGSNPDGGRFANFTVSGPAADLGLGTLVASASGAGAISLPVPDSNLGWGFFLSALGTYGQRNSLDTGSGIQPGYRFSDGGFALGTDYRFNENFAAGFSAGYSNGSAVFASNAGSVYSQSVRFGGYGTAYGGGAYANLYLGGAQDFFDTTRNIAFAGVSRSAVATPSGREFNMDAAVGYDLKGEQGTVSPFAGFSFDHLGVSRFTESGAGTLDLGVDAQDYESLRSRVGAKLSWKIPRGATTITYHVSAGWQHEFENQSQAIDAQFATGTGGPFAVTTANPNTDGALIGAGLDIDWGRGLSGKLAYVGDVRPDFNANTFSGSLRLKF